MSVTEITTRQRDDEVIQKQERRLYTLQELKDEKQCDEYPDGIVPHDVGRAYENAIETISQMESEFWDSDSAVEVALEVLAEAGLSMPPRERYDVGHRWQAEPSWDIGYHQGSMWFALPESTIVDTDKFLRAMKAWASDKGWTPDGWGPSEKFPLHQSTQGSIVDLRERSYRVIHEQGLKVHERHGFGYAATDSFEDLAPGYGEWDPYEGVTDEVKEMCNEFIQDLCHLAMTIIRDEYEYCTGDEDHLMDTAEINEWLFTKEGRMA